MSQVRNWHSLLKETCYSYWALATPQSINLYIHCRCRSCRPTQAKQDQLASQESIFGIQTRVSNDDFMLNMDLLIFFIS